MAGAVFHTHGLDRRSVHPPSESAIAGPSRQSAGQIEMLPMMTPAAWRGGSGGGGSGGDTASAEAGEDADSGAHAAGTATAAPRRSTRQRGGRLLTNDMILERALPRASHRYGLTQAIARSITLSIAIAGLASALYLVGRWEQKRGVAGVAIGANAIAIIIDVFMLVDLINTNLPRVSPYAIGGLDFVMMAAALTAGMFVGLSDQGFEDLPAPWKHVMMATAGLTWATAGVRLIYVVWSVFDCRRVRKTRNEMRNNARSNAA